MKKTPRQAPLLKRPYLKQADVPSSSLDDALRVPAAILEHYAGAPTTPLHVAKALNVDPKGSQIRLLTGASIAFGLIDGGAQAAAISITDLARRILRPKEEHQDLTAKREAVLKPRIFSDFLNKYDGHPMPREDIALNVLEEMGVPRSKAAEVYARIDSSARSVGFIEEIKDKSYVSLQGVATPAPSGADLSDDKSGENLPKAGIVPVPPSPIPAVSTPSETAPKPATKTTELAVAIADDERRRRVFITHGKNRD